MSNGNDAYIKELISKVNNATENGMKKAVVFVQAEAVKNAVERIYSKPVRGKYTRTGLYKASIKGYIKRKGLSQYEGYLESPVVYSRHLEYRCQYMCLTDAVFNNQEKIQKILKESIAEVK